MKRYQILCLVVAAVAVLSAGCSSDVSTDQPAPVAESSEALRTEVVTETSTVTVTAPPLGNVSGADVHGFVDTPARCYEDDEVLLAMRTKRSANPPTRTGSVVVFCRSGDGSLYYRGARDRPGDTGLLIRGAYRTSNAYVATRYVRDGAKYDYVAEPAKGLSISKNNVIISNEPVVEVYLIE